MAANPVDTIRLVIADDHYLVREAISRLLAAEPQFQVAAAVDEYDALMRAIEDEGPDVVVSDIRMPPTGVDEGIRMAERLRVEHPATGVVILSQYLEPRYVLRLLDGGSAGRAYLLKDRITHRNQLATAIEQVAEGGSAIDPMVVDELVKARRRGRGVAARRPHAARARGAGVWSPRAGATPRSPGSCS